MGRSLNPEQFAEVITTHGQKLIDACYRELRLQVGFVLIDELVTLSPIGDAAKDIHPGKYRASHTPSAGGPKPKMLPDTPTSFIPGDPEVVDAFKPAAPGDSVWFSNAARTEKYASKRPRSYAGILEMGRRLYTRLRGSRVAGPSTGPMYARTMWIGSRQAKLGVYDPAKAKSIERRATIRSKTARAVRAKLAI